MMDDDNYNEDFKSEALDHIRHINDWGRKILETAQAEYESLLDLLDVNKLKRIDKNMTRAMDKRTNTFVKNSRQTKRHPRQIIYSDSSLDAPADIDSEVSFQPSSKSRRKAAQVADQQVKELVKMSLHQKLRRPTNFDQVTSTMRSKRPSDEVISPLPPAKYRRTLDKDSPGPNNVVKREPGGVLVAKADTTKTVENDNTELDDKIITENNTIKTSNEKENQNHLEIMIPDYVEKGSNCYKQLTAVAVVQITSDSGISEEDADTQKNKRKTTTEDDKVSEVEETKRSRLPKVMNKTEGIKENEVETTIKTRTKGFKKAESREDYDNEDEVKLSRFRTKNISKEVNVRNDQNTDKENSVEEITNNKNVNVDESQKKQVFEKEIIPIRTRTKVIQKTKEIDIFVEDNDIFEEIKDVSEQNNTKLRNVNKKQETLIDITNLQDCAEDDKTSSQKNINKAALRTLPQRSPNMNATVEVKENRFRTKVIKRQEVTEENNEETKENEIEIQTEVKQLEAQEIDNKQSSNNSVFENDQDTDKLKCIEDTTKATNNILNINTNTPKQPIGKKEKLETPRTDEQNFQDCTNNKKTILEGDLNGLITDSCFEDPQSELVKKRVAEFEKISVINVENDGGRVTRTKTRAQKATAVITDDPVPASNSIAPVKSAFVFKTPTQDDLKIRRKIEEVNKKKKKAEEAAKTKEKTLKATAEEARRKREQKLLRAAAAREAAEKEKAALTMKHEKEREEKIKQMQMEKEKTKEAIAKKKLNSQQKLQEAEERRKKEEAARLAKIRELEEEQKRQQANREREQEAAAAERLRQKRQLEELKAKEADKLKKAAPVKLHKVATSNAAAAKLKLVGKTGASTGVDSYEMTPPRNERPILKPKDENNYGIEDTHTDDSSEDEQKPKKIIPQWATGKNRVNDLYIQKYIPVEVWNTFMTAKKNPMLRELFSEKQQPPRSRARTSSAVWSTPPSSAIK